MDFRLLGPLEAVGAEGSLALGGPKQRALLVALLLNANEVVSNDRLIDELWGEQPPRTAPAYLQNCVSRLRKVLGPEAVETRPPGYVLRVDDDAVDTWRFERLLREARPLPSAERASALRDALALWRGPALADFLFEPFAQAEISRLEELRIGALEDRIEAELELGLHDGLVGELEAFAVRHPSRERLRELQMLALYRAGRQTDALRIYQDARVSLIEELGIEPGERLRALERMILDHDPALDLPPAASAVLAVARAPAGRRPVAVLLAQLDQPGDLDPEAALAASSRRLAEATEIVDRHGGTVQQLLGDELIATFGIPRTHEDDSLRALRSATELRDALEREDVGLRVGVEAGEMLVGDGGPGLTGAAVTVARRLESRAEPGEILLGPAALRLAAGAIEVVSPESGVYRLLRVVEKAPTVARRLGAPLVGRRDELARLRAALDEAVEQRACRRVVVVGEPGKGKSRLAVELLGSLGDGVLALTGACVPYGEGATYLPLTDALRDVLGAGEPRRKIAALLAGQEDAELVAERLAGAIAPDGVATAGSEVSWAARRFLETLAHERPVVLALDDVHWAEPTLLDLVDYVAEWSADAPILLVCLGRPELLDDRPGWGGDAVVLGPLEEQDARALVEALPERGAIADDAAEAVLTTAEGNPLFLEQLTAFAAEGELREGTVPPTVEALLASRLDRLDRAERSALEWAAVVGREFAREAVAELAPADEREAVGPSLLALVRRRLVQPERALPGEDAFRFQHALVRDVAYAGVSKAMRAELHERHARWLDARPDALDEVVGFHLEQAYRHRAELGDEDAALAREAAERLGEAGRRAIARLDNRAAAGLLRRATSLLPDDDTRLELEVELGYAIKSVGDTAAAVELLCGCAEKANARGNRRVELRARIELAWPQLARGTTSATDVLGLTTDATPVFESAKDDYSLARASHVRAAAEMILLRLASTEIAAARANEHYRHAGASRVCDAMLAAAWTFGPTPVRTAIERCQHLLEDPATQRVMRPYVELHLAELDAMLGESEAARERIRIAAVELREHDQLPALPSVWARTAAAVELCAGNVKGAEAVLAPACAELREAENGAWFATHAATLADIWLRAGRVEEAQALAEDAASAAPLDDLLPQAGWRQVRAKVLVHVGEAVEAKRLAREAVALLEPTDAQNTKAEAHLTLAHVFASCGLENEAREQRRAALGLFEQKGNAAGMQRVPRG